MKLSEILSRFTVDRPQSGGWIGFCPAHDDVNMTSFSLRKYEDHLTVKCFAGCSRDEILAALGISWQDLYDYIDDEPEVAKLDAAPEDLTTPQRAGLKHRADTAARAILSAPEALEYVARRWGATVDDVARLGLGYVPDDGGRVLVTLCDGDGLAVTAQARAIDPTITPKWDSERGSGYWRAGFLGPVSGKGPVIVTEGPGDGIVAALAGYDTVAVLGASSGSAVALLAPALEDRTVYVFGDNDDAGARFAAKVAEVLPGAVPAKVPEAHNDLADWREADPKRFKKEIQLAMTTARDVAAGSAPVEPTEETAKEKDSKGVSPEAVMRFIEKNYDLCRSVDGIAYAVPMSPGTARIARELGGMKQTVSAGLWRATRKVPSTTAVPAALATAEGLASELEPEQISLRAALLPGRDMIQVDLGDASGAYVEITGNGWSVRPTDHDGRRAKFRRTPSTLALPTPRRGGSRDQLRELLGLAADDPHWRLIWGWLVGVWFEGYDRPILWLTGTQGSGKTTRAKMLLDLVDPAASLSSEPGKNHNDDIVAALGRFIPSYDNVSKVSQATSDMFCRLVTGANVDKRALYSNDEMRARFLKRAALATSLELPYGLQSDAIERTLHLDFPPMDRSERRAASDIEAEFEAVRPLILGAIFDDVVGVMRRMAEVRSAGASFQLERLADYSVVLHALDAHLGLDAEAGHAEAFRASISGGMAAYAEDDPVLSAVHAIVKAKGKWSGTMGQLKEQVVYRALDVDPTTNALPRTAHSMSSILRKGGLALEALGVYRLPSGKNRVVLELRGGPTAEELPDNVTPMTRAEGREPAGVRSGDAGPTGGADLDDVLA